MSLPQSNATLLMVSQVGASEDWDATDATGSMLWSGLADAYVQEKIRTNFSQTSGALTKSKDLQIVLPATMYDNDGNQLNLNSGDVLTFQWRGQTHSRRIIEYNGAVLAGIPNYLRVHLRPEPLEISLEND